MLYVLCGNGLWSLTLREDTGLKKLDTGAEKNLWSSERRSSRKMEKMPNEEPGLRSRYDD